MGEYMRNLPRVRATCRRGIHQDTDGVSHEYCADARNVWAPDRRIVQRPGYIGLGSPFRQGSQTVDASDVHGSIDASGTPDVNIVTAATNLDLNSLVGRQSAVDGDAYIIGFNALPGAGSYGLTLTLNLGSSNKIYMKPEYWNGTQWQYLLVTEYTASGATLVLAPGFLNHADGTGVFLNFVPPGDWATSTITDNTGGTTDYTRYWLRFTLLEGPSDTAFDATVQVVDPGKYEVDLTTVDSRGLLGVFAAEWTSNKSYHFVGASTATSAIIASTDAPYHPSGPTFLVTTTNNYVPATHTVVPNEDEAFLAYSHQVYRLTAGITTSDDIVARVEDRHIYVGAGAPFDTDVIIQLGAFPKANYILFHEGRLWAAGIDGEPFVVRWTGKQPYHKCWPALSWEQIAEDDNSPISGLFAHGDQTYVAKNDSIWIMRDKGLNAIDLREYDAHAIVRGVGVASNRSIKNIRGRSIFLGEDGVYAFDGTPNIEKLTDSIQGYIDRITPGSRQYAAGAHWRTRGVYLLSVALDGSLTNSHVLVWDYVNNAWWVWDNIGAQVWLEDENASDNEVIYFSDKVGRIFRLDSGRTDHGTAIDAWFLTHELGDEDFDAKRARCVRLAGSNNQGNTTCELRANATADRATTATVDFSDYNETNRILQKRFRRPRFKSVADFFTVKIRNNVKADVLEMSHIDLEYQRLGER